MNYSLITDICLLNSQHKTKEEFQSLFKENLFSDETKWSNYSLSESIDGIYGLISSPLKKRMSSMSLGIYYVIENGPGGNLSESEEIYLFSGFAEIDTTDNIINEITVNNYDLVSPTQFHNSVHNTPLGYYTIITKKHNYCTTISDGLLTNSSFTNFIKYRCQLDESFVISAGDEYSGFYELDKTVQLEIKPVFISYRIIPDKDKGFKFIGEYETLEKLKENEIYKNAKSVFSDKESFFSLKKDLNRKIYSEYPVVKDNPCGIIFRLSLPFLFDLKENSAVIDKTENGYSLFEVKC
jgi:hypothetical protein